jgi:hypothetical protein
MIEQFEKLTSEERELLYKAPVLVSVFASCSYNEVNALRKADAIKLARLKTFTAAPVLLPYYNEVEKNFEKEFESIAQKYFPFDKEKLSALKKEIERISFTIAKLDTEYAYALQRSLERYSHHVKKASHSIVQDFIFAFHIPGLME